MTLFTQKSNGVNEYPLSTSGDSQEPLYHSIKFGSNLENCCLRCLRSSPCSSLCGLILSFFGLGCACGGVIFGIEFTTQALGMSPFFPQLDVVAYVVTGVTALYVLSAYLLCVVCSGSNMHYVFSRKSRVTAGRVVNILFIFGCVIGVVLWTLLSCCIWTPVFAIAMFKIRENHWNETSPIIHDLSYIGIYDKRGSGLELSKQRLDNTYESLIVAFSLALAGCILTLIGFVHIAICCAANYARLEELQTYGLGITRDHGHQANTHL